MLDCLLENQQTFALFHNWHNKALTLARFTWEEIIKDTKLLERISMLRITNLL